MMLPFVSLSSWALVELLARWSQSSVRLGGFDKEEHRLAAQYLLGALFKMVGGDDAEFRIDIEIVVDWEVVWPRPLAGEATAPLIVRKGQVDLAEFMKDAIVSGGRRNGWWNGKEIKLLAQCGSMNLREAYCKVASHKKLKPMHLQLLWHIGLKLQTLVRAAADGSSAGDFRVSKVGIDALMSEPQKMDKHLLSYIQCSRAAAKKQLCFSVATDKSAVAGLGGGVQTTVFVLPQTNEAIFAPPQALGRGGQAWRWGASEPAAATGAGHSGC